MRVATPILIQPRSGPTIDRRRDNAAARALDNFFARKYTPDVGIINLANHGLNETTGTRS